MKMVNLEMSDIAALPPLCYGHFSRWVPPRWIKVFLAISAANTLTDSLSLAVTNSTRAGKVEYLVDSPHSPCLIGFFT